MPKYAILESDFSTIREVVESEMPPRAKPGRVLPVVVDAKPAYDPETHYCELAGYLVDGAKVLQKWRMVPLPVPSSITNAQCRVILICQGINPDDVLATINTVAMPSEQVRQEIKARWEYSNHIHRDDPATVQLGGILGFTPEQMDDLFRAAALIP